MQTMLAGIAQFDNDVRAERSRSGMQSVAMAGGWTQQAPVGYQIDRQSRIPILVPHPEQAPVIRMLFAQVANNTLRVRDAHGWLGDQLCRKYNPQTMHKILRNEVYVGVIRNKLTNHAPMTAAFPGLISLPIWDRVQAVLKQGMINRSERPSSLFVLRGVLRCADCGHMLTASESMGKSGHKYGYYHCKCGMRITVERAEKAWYDKLSEIGAACRPMLSALKLVILDCWQQIQTDAIISSERAKLNLKTVEKRIENLVDLHISGEVPIDLYKRKMHDLDIKAGVYRTEVHDSLLDDEDADAVMALADKLVEDLAGHYARLQAKDRKSFVKGVFGGPFTITREGIISNTSNRGIIKFLQTQNFDFSTMAPPRRMGCDEIRAFLADLRMISDLLAA